MNFLSRNFDPAFLWSYRHLAYTLFWREIKVRYKQSAFGFLWAVLKPVMMMVILSYIFGEVAGMDKGEVPYSLFVFAGVLAWDLFANTVSTCAGSIYGNRPIVERIYCPRLLIPLGASLVSLFDFLIAFAVYLVLMALLGSVPDARILLLPLIVFLTFLTGFGVGLWLAAVAVWYRDIKFVTGYLLNVGMLLSPVGYATSAIPERFSFLATFNPMVPIIELYRWALLGSPSPDAGALLLGGALITLLLIGGLLFFARLEQSFADVI